LGLLRIYCTCSELVVKCLDEKILARALRACGQN